MEFKSPPTGGRWMCDPETGELTKVDEDEPPAAEPEIALPEAAPAAEAEAPATPMKRK